jgi:hypothetical protein
MEKEKVVYSFKYPNYYANRRFFVVFLAATVAILFFRFVVGAADPFSQMAIVFAMSIPVVSIGLCSFHFTIQEFLLKDGDIFRVAFSNQYACLYIYQTKKTQKVLLANPSISFRYNEKVSTVVINEYEFTCSKKDAASVEAFLKKAKLKAQTRLGSA